MSHASGTATFEDNTIYHFEFDGTIDVCISDLYYTFDEMHNNWRQSDRKKICTCGSQGEPVELHNNYGGGHIDREAHIE